jgi:segregation and condensation protein B
MKMKDTELTKQVEALLFSSGRKMEPEELAKLAGISSVAAVKEALNELKKDYDERQSPMMIFEEGETWKLSVREPYLPLVRKINPYTEFPKSIMETLAVIAWKQPILQSTVIKIRTNKAYDHIAELMEMGFVIKEKYGRTSMLKLTQKFYDYFDLQDQNRVKELFKRFKDEEKMEQKRMIDFEMQVEGKKKEEVIEELKIEAKIEKNETQDLAEISGETKDAQIMQEAKKFMGEKGEETELIEEIAEAENKEDILEENNILKGLGTIQKGRKRLVSIKKKRRR